MNQGSVKYNTAGIKTEIPSDLECNYRDNYYGDQVCRKSGECGPGGR